jgi:hypothetical protein
MEIRTSMKISAVYHLALCCTAVICLQASPVQEKIYDVPKATVIYKISGGGALTPDLNLTLEGTGKLSFKDWGAVELLEEHIEEKTTGTLHYVAHRDMCEKHQKNQILDVDFKHKKIRERLLPEGKGTVNLTEGLSLTGQQMVANVVCDMWEGEGVKRCLYKGIPLFTEYQAVGILYREEAVDVSFDINITDKSHCSIPAYPVEKFALYTGNFKTRSKKTPKSFSERVKEVLETVRKKRWIDESVPPREKKQLLEKIGEPVFEKEKQLLPDLLQTMKKSRACLVQAQSTQQANHCLNSLVKLKTYFTDNSQNRVENWEKERTKLLERFDENIVFLQSKMKCVRGAKNLHDLSVCMK